MTLSIQAIVDYIAAHPGARREDIRRQAAPDASETTVWRALKRLVDERESGTAKQDEAFWVMPESD